MITEQRYEIILNLLDEQGSVTAAELKEVLRASESTVRRDITALARAGKLTKVFGGAVSLEGAYISKEPTVAQKLDVSCQEKIVVARYGASLIEPEDFVYIDAGTTTGYMLDYLTERRVTYVTNAVSHAQRLARENFHVLLIGGELKSSTEAVVGSQAMMNLKSYHFTKAFMGTNGISKKDGFTTPDPNEALVKRTAMEQAAISYILADGTKLGTIAPVTFAEYGQAEIIVSGRVPESFVKDENVIIVS